VAELASYEWDADRVRALRSHLGASQQELADRLGTRQQTVSEWETASSRPRRMSRRLLTLVAEEAGFYDAASNGERSAEGGAR
jgi:DNA-binding transcriptional regulator YiaG